MPDHVIMGLATKDDKRAFKAGATIAFYILSQGISIGDVVTIDAESGRVTRTGRSEEAAERYDIAAFAACFSELLRPRKIDAEIRIDVDGMVKQRVEVGSAEIISGVLFIDEVHLTQY